MKKNAIPQLIVEDKLILQLYVSGMSVRSMEAIENIKRLCDEHLKDAFELEVIDISDIQHPQLKNTVAMNHPFGLGIDNSKLFICDDKVGLKLYDSSDPLQLKLTQTIVAGETRDVIPIDNLLFLVSTDGLYQFDYSSNTLVQLSYLPITK